MNAFFHCFSRLSHKRKVFFRIFALFICSLLLLILIACKKEIDYFSYVSELRDNTLLAENETLSLRVYSVRKENPYIADGVARETSKRTEVYISVPAGDKECLLSFSVDGKPLGGDASYDNVKGEYYYSCSADASDLETLAISVTYGDTVYELTAVSVKRKDTLSPKAALQKLIKEESALFQNLTDEYGFAGEIYLRLLYEDSPYYYVGVIDRDGKTTAFLLNAQSGKILAKRES